MDYACSNPECPECGRRVTLPDAAYLCSNPDCGREMKKCCGLTKRHFVQYHKTGDNGAPASSNGCFAIDTNKKAEADKAHGCTVWLFTGNGTPRKYYLDCVFVVDNVRVNDADDNQRYSVLGKKGHKLTPPVPVSGHDWFSQLRESLGNFAAGFSEIDGTTAARLETLVKKRGKKMW